MNLFFAEFFGPGYVDFNEPPKKGNWTLKACESVKFWQHWPALSSIIEASVCFCIFQVFMLAFIF